ncbi:WbqC family protein [Carboxylicivirga sp. M1479]|uniref:WbqC family protein n=1 Tax=Carboxylicivirga sp. M1479 TaxID=2594476 RepID=UPI001177DA2F|nr:WbqC family protein [Carboxylicivirga sp. M1479]TRX63554.1 WbqC family protein [Carboxylicivirga sp. M1479]
MQTNKLIPLTYLGSIQLFSHVVNANEIVLEQHANYQRKTYTNRCSITGANGSLSLAVPVVKSKSDKTSIKDTLISYDTDWQKQHWRSIVSAYNSSPFFEYYADDFQPFYEKHTKYLVDFNMALFNVILDELEIEPKITLSEHYIRPNEFQHDDVRPFIHPKAKPEDDPCYQSIEYRQVFSEKYSFIPNLSVIDLLFNKGPETYDILKDSLLTKI